MSQVTKYLKRMAITILFICSVNQTAFAVPILSFNNAQADVSQVANIGDVVTLELWFSGLESDDIGGFDFLLSFNNIVSPLNSAQANLSLTDFDVFNITPSLGALEFSGISYLFDLSAQVDEFMLATISFVASRVGVSDIVLSELLISDSFASSIDVSAFDAQIVVNADPNMAVPEPVSIGIFILGILGLTTRHRMKRLD
jgi:hypothetical protein